MFGAYMHGKFFAFLVESLADNERPTKNSKAFQYYKQCKSEYGLVLFNSTKLLISQAKQALDADSTEETFKKVAEEIMPWIA